MATALLTPSVRLSTRRFVGLVAAAAAAVRLGTLSGPLFSDEAGYSLVAQGWRSGGPNLYGHYFVDRPPLLLALYRVAVVSGWPQTVRLEALLASVLLVVTAAWSAQQVAGERGARWAAMVAAALTTTPLLLAQEADGELFATPLVMLGVALTLAAVRRRGWRGFALAVAAGVAAGAAVMVKQNFADAVVFAGVLLAASLLQRRLTRRDTLVIAGGGVLGGTLVVLAALAFVVWSRVGLAVAWTAVLGSRSAAFDVIEDHSMHAPMIRAAELAGLGVVAGLLPFVVVLALDALRCAGHGPPVAWAVAATVGFELVGMALGGSYWSHYLLQLAPMLALAAGVWAPDSRRVRQAATFVLASAVAASSVMLLSGASLGNRGQAIGTWVRRSSLPGDTATVLFGNAEVQRATGMVSPYPQLWTLPMRIYDPQLSGLRRVLRGPTAPVWLVATGGLNPWRIDAHDRLRVELASRYRPVATVCGDRVYLRDGLHRPLAPGACPSAR